MLGVMPTIPEYYKKYIDRNVDLTETPSICCPFHKEDTPSFSYSEERGLWRCWGACHCGGDVITLHQKNYRLSSRKEAKSSLMRLYKISSSSFLDDKVFVSKDKIFDESVYQLALLVAGDNVERWIELDYIMSIYPIDSYMLLDFCNKYGYDVKE